MSPSPETRRMSHNLRIPSAATVTDAPTDQNTQSIREDIVAPLSEGDHHAASLPSTGTVLPSRTGLQNALDAVQTYLYNIGCAVLADAHLRGLSAPVQLTGDGLIYAYLDEELFYDVIMEALQETDLVEHDLAAEDSMTDLADAVLLAHNLEFQQSMQEFDLTPTDAASWPVTRGQETPSPTGVVFSTPHPVTMLDDHPGIPERAIALVGGIQHLTADIDGVFGQRDVAAVYLHAYLTGHGFSMTQATRVVSTWYELPEQCFTSLRAQFSDDVIEAGSEAGLPAADAEFAYYLTSPAQNRLSEPFTASTHPSS